MFFGCKEDVCCVDIDKWVFIGGWGGGGEFGNSVKSFVPQKFFGGEDFILRGVPYVE